MRMNNGRYAKIALLEGVHRIKQKGRAKKHWIGQAVGAHDLEDRGKQLSVSSRPGCSTRTSYKTGSKATEKLCLGKKKTG